MRTVFLRLSIFVTCFGLGELACGSSQRVPSESLSPTASRGPGDPMPCTESASKPRVKPARFEIYRVADERDLFARRVLPSLDTKPGGEIVEEPAPPGFRSELGITHYARFAYLDGETRQAATARARAVLALVPIPYDVRLVLEEIEFEESHSGVPRKALRTHVVVGNPIVTTLDIVEAHAVRDSADPSDIRVSIELSYFGSQRLQLATSEWVHRRMAILIDDEVKSAPLVTDAISGGHFQLSLANSGDANKTFADAQTLAQRLTI